MAKWIPDLPLHLAPDDYSPDACELRLHLYQAMFTRSHGKGFRVASGTSPKRKHPRRGHRAPVTRIDTLYLIARHGERNVQPPV